MILTCIYWIRFSVNANFELINYSLRQDSLHTASISEEYPFPAIFEIISITDSLCLAQRGGYFPGALNFAMFLFDRGMYL